MKVFGLGLSRTGTSSLAAALQLLGYRAKHFPSLHFFAGRLWGLKRRELRDHDAFTDIPVIPSYRQLDARWPGSKFILTERDIDAWLDSCARYSRFRPTFKISRKARAIRRAVYGTESFCPERFREASEAHTAAVHTHFADRPESLLRMDITAGAGWETLCPFLGLPIPDQEFPRLNARGATAPART